MKENELNIISPKGFKHEVCHNLIFTPKNSLKFQKRKEVPNLFKISPIEIS
jgi:hypothetical protein